MLYKLFFFYLLLLLYYGESESLKIIFFLKFFETYFNLINILYFVYFL